MSPHQHPPEPLPPERRCSPEPTPPPCPVCAAGVDLSRIRCSPKTNGQGPSELPHHAPWTQPLSEEAALLPLPTPGSMPTAFDWAALAHDSPTSSEENQMSDAHTMPFAEHEASSVRDTPSSEVRDTPSPSPPAPTPTPPPSPHPGPHPTFAPAVAR